MPVVIIANTTQNTTTVVITPSLPSINDQVSFNIALIAIQELAPNNGIFTMLLIILLMLLLVAF